MQPKQHLPIVYMARSGPTYSIEGAGMGLNEWSLALPLLQDIITNGPFVFNANPYTFPPYQQQEFFRTVIKSLHTPPATGRPYLM